MNDKKPFNFRILVYALISFAIEFGCWFLYFYDQTMDYAAYNEYASQHLAPRIMSDLKNAAFYSIIAIIISVIVGLLFESKAKDKKIHKWGMIIVPAITIVISFIVFIIMFFSFFRITF